MVLQDIEPRDPRLEHDVLGVLRELRPHLTGTILAAVYAEGYPQGLRFLAAYDKDRCIGVSGWRIIANTSAIRKLYVDDLVTSLLNGIVASVPYSSPNSSAEPETPVAISSTWTRASSAATPIASTNARD